MGRGDFFNAIPVIGHIKGVYHVLDDNDEAAKKAFNSATRTVAVVGSGVAAGIVSGPVGAFAAGAAAGTGYDLVHSSVADGPRGTVKRIDDWVENPSMGNAAKDGLGVALDGATGSAGHYGAQAAGLDSFAKIEAVRASVMGHPGVVYTSAASSLVSGGRWVGSNMN